MRLSVFQKIFIAFCLLVAATVLQAQPRVTNVAPRQNEIHVPITGSIAVTFSENINPSTLNTGTWLVHGSQSGLYSGAISYDSATRTGQFTPARFFKEGEIVSVTLTAGIQNNSGQPIAPRFQWSFTISVEFGTGIFDERIEIPIGENALDPTAIYAGDFDNDLFPDLAVVNSTSNSVSILPNRFFTFGGSFDAPKIVSVGNGPNAITGGDFDNDGLLDLAVSNFDDNSISLLRNTGAANFILSQTLATAEHPTQAEARDFNNDGQLDLAATILGINRLQIFLNQGSGILSPADIYATGASPYGLTTGDFDNDGDQDIAVTNSGDNSIFVYKNNGQAQFVNAGEILVPDFPTALKTNDLIGRDSNAYGDGVLDLALVHPNANSVSILENRSRDGGFVLSEEIAVGVQPGGVFIGPVDTLDATAQAAGLGKDHDLDIAVPNLLSNNLHLLRNQLNNGFSAETNDVFPAGQTPLGIAGADFDRDGDMDLAVTNLLANRVSVLLNLGGLSGSIRFTQPTLFLDFGQVYVGSDSTRTFGIINPTNENISLDEISTTLPVFTVSASQAVIGPGERFDLDVIFAPTDTVVYEDSLTIRSTAFGISSETKIGMRGEGIIAIITVVPDTLNFGNVQLGQSRTLPIQISNGGNGALNISALEFTDPAFSAPVNQLAVPPHASQQVDITFTPAAAISYLDTLTVVNNDSSNSRVPVILLGGPNAFPPQITSADSVTAIEDVFFQYVATATDPDGTPPLFLFRDLPRWLRPSSISPANNAVDGTPREGDRDTSFVVIARDALFSDTLAVFVRVLPVNDPPVFNPIANQVATELTLLTFQLSATDPEDSTLTFSSPNLPAGSNLITSGRNTATFTWVPPFGSRGVYNVTFMVREVFEANPLSDTTVVRITVNAVLPDLVAASLSVNNSDIALNQTRMITGVARCDLAPVITPFRLTFLHNDVVMKDTLVAGMALGQQISFNYLATFDRLGDHEIVFFVDFVDQVSETNEENNSATLRLRITKGEVVVRPNPFTPNADSFNDLAEFDYSELRLAQPQLKIFKFNGALLTTLEVPVGLKFQWDGKDRNGREQQPGIYLYVLSDGNERVASGYVVLAR